MREPKEMDVVRRAYELWQQAGQPAGKDDEFYHLAKNELREILKRKPADQGEPSGLLLKLEPEPLPFEKEKRHSDQDRARERPEALMKRQSKR